MVKGLIVVNYMRYIVERRMNVDRGYNEWVWVGSGLRDCVKELLLWEEGGCCVGG